MADPEPGGLEGALVEVHGVGAAVEPYLAEEEEEGGPGWEPVEVDGRTGRCLQFCEEQGKYIVQLFSAEHVLIAEENLREWEPPSLEEGGFDLAWPSALPGGPPASEALPLFAGLLTEALSQKGWCLVQLIVDDSTREEAVAQAQELPHTASFKAELLPDYLGRGGSGKVSVLEYQGLNGLMLGEDAYPWALSAYDCELTALARALAPLTQEALGFKSSGRRKAMVCAPFASEAEERELQPEMLTDEDVDAGVLEAHLKFVRQRRLCFMSWVDNKGGEVTLYPRQDMFPGSPPVSLPLTPGKLLVYRCDWMSYAYRPLGDNAVALTTWVVDDTATAPDLDLAYLEVGDLQARSEMMGIMVGPPMPLGYRMHAMIMHTKTPGGVHEIARFQSLFLAGVDGFIKIPLTRFDTDMYCSEGGEKDFGKSYVIHAAMLGQEDMVMFDSNFFGIPDEEAKHMSPAQRLVLQEGYTALHLAGFTRETLRGRRTGCYCGDTGTDWSPYQVLEALPVQQNPYSGQAFGNIAGSPYMLTGVSNMITAGRLTYCLGLAGCTQSVDTACSASLVGVHTAVQGMRRPEAGQPEARVGKGEVDALCMGISTLLSPWSFIGLCGPSMLSKKGRCFTFDHSASGYARGDGFSGLYVKPSDSEEDNAKQKACLMGVHVNQDGRSATLTAPNGVAQQACIRDSMREAGVVPNQITIAECHGTGTALGDPIEVGALRGVMEPRETPLLATSSKSNLGHMEACAGLVGLLKCILMVMTSNGPPNIHLCDLNPHLDVDGFPTYFETEHCETRLNSNYAGVSSFGFSGTNARADVWSQCKAGPRRTGGIDLSVVDQVHVRCPVTMGLIEHLTGEPVTRSFRQRRKYKADVLREEWAPYDVSSYAYEGAFRYRREPLLDAQDEDLDPEVGVGICGSWSGWTRTERMQPQGGGWYAATVALGEGRYELFHIRLGEKDKGMLVYPAIPNASQRIWVEGPGASQEGRNWIIDGRDLEVPSGTLYEIRFRWHSERMAVQWEPIVGIPINPVAEFEHCYCLLGTFSSGQLHDMRRVAGEEGTWEGSFRLGVTGTEEFQISRDGDMGQLIYPAQPQTLRTTVPVRGPDGMGKGKRWLVRGPTGDGVTVRLRILDAHIAVTVASEVKGAKVYESVEGWERHQYSVVGSWTNWAPVAMVPDAEAPGVFRAFAKLGEMYSSRAEAFVELFQVVVDDDAAQAFHPMVDGSDSGQHIVLGPDGDGDGKNWAVLSAVPNARFEICLDLTAVDRRKMVTWTWMTSPLGYGDY